MKNLFLLVVLTMVFSTAYADRSYECHRYTNGKPTGYWIKVKAGSQSEAESKAYSRFKEMGKSVDSVNCS